MIDNTPDELNINEFTEKLKQQMGGLEEINDVYKKEVEPLKKENLEKFLLEKTGDLVSAGLDTLRELKDAFINNPDAEEIDALSQVFRAVSSGLSVLKDIQVTSMKNESNRSIKEMEINARKELKDISKDENLEKIFLTRDEVLRQLVEKSVVVDAEFVKTD